ncbi:MAG: proline dehydrogenase [Maribacter sp.]|jgi:proline dehydrogenase
MSEKHIELVVNFRDIKTAFDYKSDAELKKAGWLFKMMSKPKLVAYGSKLGMKALSWGLPFTESIIKKTIFAQFCGGTSLPATQATINKLYDYKVLTVLDVGVEAKESEADFNNTMSETLKAIDFGSTNLSVPIVSAKVTGLARFALLEKIQKKKGLNPQEQKEWDKALERIDIICDHATNKQVGVFFDAEETWIQDTIDDVVNVMMEKYNRGKVYVYNTYQMYRHDRLEYLKKSHQQAVDNGYIIGAKLVRGAYMEKERARAKEKGYPSPIQEDKNATDNDYNSALQYCIENHETISSCNATHNEFSSYVQAEIMEQLNIPRDHAHINFCQLYGMSDHITFNLAKNGFNAAKYVPYGTVQDVIPYLIRRAQENSSVTGEMGRELSFIKEERNRRGV